MSKDLERQIKERIHLQKNAEIYCNQCGKKLEKCGKVSTEDFLHVEKDWGYFSKKDGMCHAFDLCEECVKKLEEGFRIPADVWEKTTIL